MDTIFKPCKTHYVHYVEPRTPKSQCSNARVTKSGVRGLISFVHALQITLTLNFGGEGVVPDRKGWICRPSTVPTAVCGMPHTLVGTVSLSDVFTSCCLQTLLRKDHTLHAADLIPNCAKHGLFTSKCLLSVSRPIYFYSLIRNLFQAAQNIVFSQVSATFVLPVRFFLFPNPNCKKHCVFTGKCCMCLSSHFFLFPNSRLIRLTWPCQWIIWNIPPYI